MIYRGPGFLAVVWFGSLPTPFSHPLSLVSKLDWRNTGRLRKRDTLLTGEGGGYRGEGGQIIRKWKGLVLYESINTLWARDMECDGVFTSTAFCCKGKKHRCAFLKCFLISVLPYYLSYSISTFWWYRYDNEKQNNNKANNIFCNFVFRNTSHYYKDIRSVQKAICILTFTSNLAQMWCAIKCLKILMKTVCLNDVDGNLWCYNFSKNEPQNLDCKKQV